MSKQTISPRLLSVKQAAAYLGRGEPAIREMIWAGITLWYYSDLMSARERILSDEIPIDGGRRIEDLIELLTAQNAGIDQLCAQLEGESPELFGRRFPKD